MKNKKDLTFALTELLITYELLNQKYGAVEIDLKWKIEKLKQIVCNEGYGELEDNKVIWRTEGTI